MLIGPVIMELRYEEVEKSSLENSKIGVTKKITDFSKLNCPTSSYHNSTNTGPIDMEQDGIIHFCHLVILAEFIVVITPLFLRPNSSNVHYVILALIVKEI